MYYTAETVFHVHMGTEYVIMGMGIFKGGIVVLIRDETGSPGWYPIGLFEMSNPTVPSTWRFRVIDIVAASSGRKSLGWVAIWAYPEIVDDLSQIDRLNQQDHEALDVFFSRLAEASSAAPMG